MPTTTTLSHTMLLPLEELRAARDRVAPTAHLTPVLTSRYFDRASGAELFFKCESFQKGGAFKYRGATNTLACLSPEERSRGVVTHSSGNHAQAVALAARTWGCEAYVVMPRASPAVKIAAVEEYGARVTLCEPTQAARESTTRQIIDETGATLVHPYDDPRIIAGQATAAMELFEQAADLDLVVTPVGGGGLLAGTALAAHYLSPRTRVFAGEPAGADDAIRSLEAGSIQTVSSPHSVADGLLARLGEQTFPVIRELVESIVRVSDAEILRAMRQVFERMKLVIEPSAAVPLAAVLSGRLPVAGRRVGIILTGGNIDLGGVDWRSV